MKQKKREKMPDFAHVVLGKGVSFRQLGFLDHVGLVELRKKLQAEEIANSIRCSFYK
jgi:hypothetical protein